MVLAHGDLQVDDRTRTGGPERCGSVGGGIASQEATLMADVFKALSSPVRVQLLWILQAASGGELCVCDLVGRLGLSQSTVSHHLRILVDAGLLRREARGTWAWYAITPGGLSGVQALFT
jgi:ArsR family transcriptional regulator, arsenate/arsenite/antimonite-responsive transcriptional repressor